MNKKIWAVAVLGVVAGFTLSRAFMPQSQRYQLGASGLVKLDAVTGQAWILSAGGGNHWAPIAADFNQLIEQVAASAQANSGLAMASK